MSSTLFSALVTNFTNASNGYYQFKGYVDDFAGTTPVRVAVYDCGVAVNNSYVCRAFVAYYANGSIYSTDYAA